jgi:hypothetical protein
MGDGMTGARITIRLTDGRIAMIHCPPETFRRFESGDPIEAKEAVWTVMDRLRDTNGDVPMLRGFEIASIVSIERSAANEPEIALTITDPRVRHRSTRSEPVGQAGPSRTVRRCGSLLGAASRLLPSSVRDEAVDEWLDEIETAAEDGRPILRRTLSILQSLPIQAWRVRRAVRVRPGER